MKPQVKSERFNLIDPGEYIIGALWENKAECVAQLNGNRLETAIEPWKSYVVLDRFDAIDNEEFESVVIRVKLPVPLPKSGKFCIYSVKDGNREVFYKCPVSKLAKKEQNPQTFVDQLKYVSPTSITLSGWVAAEEEVDIKAYASDGTLLNGQLRRFPRVDVQSVFEECEVEKNCGFQLRYENVNTKEVKIVFTSSRGTADIKIPMTKGRIFMDARKMDIRKALHYLKSNGFSAFIKKVFRKLGKKDAPVEYSEWVKHNFATPEQLEEQKKTEFDYKPLISIVVPLYKTPEKFLNRLIESVKGQTYSNWELVLSDGSGENSPMTEVLRKIAAEDSRIKVIEADKQYRIVENTNRAIEHATGEYIAFGDHDDVLAPDALFECVKALNNDRDIEFIYTDEDKINMTETEYFEPQMKPDFNLDLLRTVNYICHMCVMKRSLLDKTGYLDANFEGAQDYDLVLRTIENTKHICHIPKVLYHWRTHNNSTSDNPESKKYAFEAGRRAIQAHFDRLGIKAKVKNSDWAGLYKTDYIRAYDPLVSILIPNKDHIDDLERCIDSICRKSKYRNFEIVVIENNSDQDETFEYYKRLEQDNPKVRIVYYEGNFNFSKINNFGASKANGEYFILLNNDTSVINEYWIDEMLGYCMRKDVGVVGAQLFYEDNTIQHAGVVIGFGGIAGHCFVMQPRGTTGYCHRIISPQDYSAVTAACMMVDRKVFFEVGEMSEDLAVAFNDIDFCMKVRSKGYLIVYNPYVQLYHFESKSRGLEDTPEKVSRFNSEIDTFSKKWGDFLEKGDPYYSPNLTLDSQDFSLKKNW